MTSNSEDTDSSKPCFASQNAVARGACNEPVLEIAITPREAWRSDELLGDRTEVLILHNNEVYRLRRTRQGKLILHK